MSRYPNLLKREPPQENIYTVSAITDLIKDALENGFPAVWVSGEISNFSRPQSGHCYLTLKDDGATLRAVVWRSTAERLAFELEDGLEVVCLGALEVYPPRGGYQLVVRQVVPKGLGALELKLRKLKEKLSAEGLFDPARKRPLPRFPRRIALITSPTGAAIRDFLQVLGRRWRGADVLIVPVRVQGEGSANEIAKAIHQVNTLPNQPDVIVLARGGGSLEDLWSFNEEVVVRAIHRARAPVVSAIGHEIDVTLSDLVADVRALTPSEAAELVAPPADELAAWLRAQHVRLHRSLRSRAADARLRLDQLQTRRALRKPFERFRALAQRLDILTSGLNRGIRARAVHARRQLESFAGRAEALSPLAVLARGYSLTTRASDDTLVRDAATLHSGDELLTRLARGRVTSRVERVDRDPPVQP